MEVKPGYKRTEVGVIPEEWEVKRLNEVADLQVGFAFKSDWFGKHIGTRLLRGENVGYGTADWSDTRTLEGKQEAGFRSYLLNAGEVIIGMDRTFTKTGSKITLISEGDCPCLLVQRVGRFVPRGCDQSFLWFVLSSETVQARLRLEQKGMDIPHLSRSEILHPFAIFPPLPEQRAIATALSDVDGLLGGLDRLIAKKRDLKQAAMQQLLTGQTRLPGFHGEWEVKTLFELAARKKELFNDGDWIESEHITTEGIRLIQTGNIGVGSFVEKDDKKYINEASFASLRCKQLKQGDLLVCRLADPAGRACVLGDIGEDRIVTSVDVTIFRPPAELANRQFLSQVFSTSDWFRAVSDRSGGTTHKRISRGALGRLSINLPPLAEQTAIATVLSEMDGELAVLEQRREKTRALKQAMMQELLTGRTRLV